VPYGPTTRELLANRNVLLLLTAALAVSSCASEPPQHSASHKKLKLETIDHGPQRPKTYLYREVDEPANR